MTEKLKKWLPVHLDDETLLVRSRQMAEKCREKREVEIEKAGKMKVYGERLKDLSGEISTLSQTIMTGKEHAEVECFERPNWTTKRVDIVRADTGEVVEERHMPPEDLQTEIPLTAAGHRVEDEGRIEAWGPKKLAEPPKEEENF
jgi:hypothetical protein